MDYKKYDKYLNFIEKYKKAINASTGSEVDSNANVESKNVTTLTGELYKKDGIGINRNMMVKKITSLYGEDLAKEYIRQLDSHEIYRHDETHPMYPYCVSITMYPFLFNGLKTIGGLSGAPHHLKSFCGGFVNLVFAIASQFAGAVSTPEFLSYMDYFIRKEYGEDYYKHATDIVDSSLEYKTIDNVITSYFEQVVYSLNQPAAARNFQSVFWNIAYFDHPYFNGIFENFVFPDGTTMKWESVNWLQKRFMNWLNDERLKTVLTFPVETVNLLDNGKDYVDQEWKNFVAEMYSKGHSFFTYRSNSVDSLASCCRLRNELQDNTFSFTLGAGGVSTGCYDDKTEVLTDNRGWILFSNLTKNDILITRNQNGNIEKNYPDKIFKYRYNDKLYHFQNSVFDMMVTPNHNMVYCNKHNHNQSFIRADQYSCTKHPIPRTAINNQQDVKSFILPEIKTDWLTGNHESQHSLKWEAKTIQMNLWNEFLGWYLSEGSCDNEKIAMEHGYRTIITQIKPDNIKIISKLLDQLPFNYNYTNNQFIICNKQLWNYCKQFGDCYEKYIPRDILQNCSSKELNHLLKTLMLGNGSINKISGQKTYYTSSHQLANDFQELCLKCGYSTNIRIRNPRNCCIEGRFYSKENNHKMYEMTITKNKYFYIKKENINTVDYNGYVYCCEVKNHTLMVRRNGKATWCGNSKGVITINVNRLVQNATKAHKDISDTVREQVIKIHKYLLAYNSILYDNYNAGLLGIYNAGYISLEKQFLTIGINGFVEGAEFLGIKINPDNEEYFKYGESILKPIYEENKKARTKEVMFNTEFVPKQCGHKVA